METKFQLKKKLESRISSKSCSSHSKPQGCLCTIKYTRSNFDDFDTIVKEPGFAYYKLKPQTKIKFHSVIIFPTPLHPAPWFVLGDT